MENAIQERIQANRTLPALQYPGTCRKITRPDHQSKLQRSRSRTKREPGGFMKMAANKENAIRKRTFRSALIEMLEREYKLIGSHKVIELTADDICQLRDEFYPQIGEEAYGSLTWVTTSSDKITSVSSSSYAAGWTLLKSAILSDGAKKW